jgi:hypothetical protein
MSVYNTNILISYYFYITEYPRKMLSMHATYPGSNLEGHGQTIPSTMFLLCGVWAES